MMNETSDAFDFQKEYEEVLPLLLDDHTRHFSSNRQLFHDTFFNRSPETERFASLLTRKGRDQTILIIGNAGVGKTSFVYRIAYAKRDQSEPAILPLLADFKTAVPQDNTGCLLGFIEHCQGQFASIDAPIDLAPNTPEAIPTNIRLIREHVERVAADERCPRILLFLDDFDYAEDKWYALLDYFLPFVQAAGCTVVLTMRPALYASLQAYDERLRFYFGLNVSPIRLNPMHAREVLASRLAPLLVKRQSRSILNYIVDHFRTAFNGQPELEKALARLKVDSLETLASIDYPFTEKHNDFMHLVTNGNLREIMAIALDSLLYILRRWKTLEEREEHGITRKVIGRQGVIDIFWPGRAGARYQLTNVNEYRSLAGNSLLFNVLEAIKIHPTVDDGLFKLLRGLGHSERDVRWAVANLSHKSQRLIEAKWVVPPRNANSLRRYDEYEISDKGNYYLDLATWPEYVAKAGPVGRSLIGEVKAAGV